MGTQDTCYLGTIMGVGRTYEHTFLDAYTKASFAELYHPNSTLVAPDLLNDRVISWFEKPDVKP